jgi:hypothetical protein
MIAWVRRFSGWGFTAIRQVLLFGSTSAATALFMPGIALRIGCRVVIARLAGVSVRHGSFINHFGGQMEIEGNMSPWKRVTLYLLPSLMLGVMGGLALLPVLMRNELLGVPIFGTVGADPSVVANNELPERALPALFAVHGDLDLLRIWVALGCFYCAALPAAEMGEVMSALNRARRRPRLAQAVRTGIKPFYVASRALGAVDEAALWLGFNVLIGSGGVAIFIWLIISRNAASWWIF